MQYLFKQSFFHEIFGSKPKFDKTKCSIFLAQEAILKRWHRMLFVLKWFIFVMASSASRGRRDLWTHIDIFSVNGNKPQNAGI